jgi:hypothetical protein
MADVLHETKNIKMSASLKMFCLYLQKIVLNNKNYNINNMIKIVHSGNGNGLDYIITQQFLTTAKTSNN